MCNNTELRKQLLPIEPEVEEFDRVAVGVFDLNLVATGAGGEVVAEADALVFSSAMRAGKAGRLI
jgi:hypothetical protein